MSDRKMPEVIPARVVGIPTEPILVALTAAVMGAVILPMIPIKTWYATGNKWSYGGIWFVLGVLVAVFGYAKATGVWRALMLGASISFFIAAALQWGGWSYAK